MWPVRDALTRLNLRDLPDVVRNVMVMAVIRDSTNRRLFEDRMVAALTATGVKAVQSYKFILQDGPVSEEQLRRAWPKPAFRTRWRAG